MQNSISNMEFNIFDVWGKLGITEHPGGIYATKKLIDLCDIKPGQYILNIGCGTGYTACLLAKKYYVYVIASDINLKLLEHTRKRIIKEKVSNKVKVIEADAHELIFPDNTFDAVIAEAVLVFCDKEKVASEVYRVLKPGGVFGDNEVTYLKPPSDRLLDLLSSSVFTINFKPLPENQWRAIFRDAGFFDVSSKIYKYNLWEQLRSRLRADGILKHFSALFKGLSDPTMRIPFFKKDTFKLLLNLFSSHFGYGLYLGRKIKEVT